MRMIIRIETDSILHRFWPRFLKCILGPSKHGLGAPDWPALLNLFWISNFLLSFSSSCAQGLKSLKGSPT